MKGLGLIFLIKYLPTIGVVGLNGETAYKHIGYSKAEDLIEVVNEIYFILDSN